MIEVPWRIRQEDLKLEASLGLLTRPSLKMKKYKKKAGDVAFW